MAHAEGDVQALFHRSNEKIAWAMRRLSIDWAAPFLCECPDSRCIELIRLLLREYEGVRARSGCYMIRPGHTVLDHQQIVDRFEHFHVVH